MTDSIDLQRFIDAQAGGIYETAVRELQSGQKRSHWMWFVFPQIAGLGRSPTAQHFAISGRSEAHAYLTHPVLGSRILECARILTGLGLDDPVSVFGFLDAQKLRSSMTLFSRVAATSAEFQEVLDQYFAGQSDDATISRLEGSS